MNARPGREPSFMGTNALPVTGKMLKDFERCPHLIEQIRVPHRRAICFGRAEGTFIEGRPASVGDGRWVDRIERRAISLFSHPADHLGNCWLADFDSRAVGRERSGLHGSDKHFHFAHATHTPTSGPSIIPISSLDPPTHVYKRDSS